MTMPWSNDAARSRLISIVRSRRFIGNGGGAPGVNAEFRFEPAGDSTVVVLANASPPAATELLTEIMNRIADVAVSAASPPPMVMRAPSSSAPGGVRSEVDAGRHRVRDREYRRWQQGGTQNVSSGEIR
jgi:hypothetical protein